MSQRTRLITLALLALLLCPSLAFLSTPAVAQDVPSAREQRQTLEDGGLPEPTDIGTGWSLGAAFSFTDGTFPFDLHEAHYADRWGTRIFAYAAIHDRRSAADALDFGQSLIDTYSNVLFESELSPSAREIRSMDDPAACEVTSRVAGEEPIALYFFGAIMCHDLANDRVLVVGVSGNYDGLTFLDAADAVLQIVLDTEPGG